jgi:hypothetical protein
MVRNKCSECARLWQAFVNATMTHIRVTNRQALAERGYIVALPGALEHALKTATDQCAQARQMIREHERSHAPASTEDLRFEELQGS